MTPSSSSYARCLVAGRSAFPGFELHVLAQTPSTQDRVREAARAGAAAGYCVVAAEQTAGRGRQDRRWVAPAGTALLTSVLVDAGNHIAAIPLAAGLAVCDALDAFGVNASLKWPNDVLVDGRKLAGILAETEPRAARRVVILGIGVNLTVPDFPEGAVAVSLHTLVAAPEWHEVLAAILPALRRRLDALNEGGVAAIERDWLDRATGIGAEVVAETPAGVVRGVATGIDSDGALLVETEHGVVRLLAGDVHIAR